MNTNMNAPKTNVQESVESKKDQASELSAPRADLTARIRTGVKAGRCCW